MSYLDVCKCGHVRSSHVSGSSPMCCYASIRSDDGIDVCNCPAFSWSGSVIWSNNATPSMAPPGPSVPSSATVTDKVDRKLTWHDFAESKPGYCRCGILISSGNCSYHPPPKVLP